MKRTNNFPAVPCSLKDHIHKHAPGGPIWGPGGQGEGASVMLAHNAMLGEVSTSSRGLYTDTSLIQDKWLQHVVDV